MNGLTTADEGWNPNIVQCTLFHKIKGLIADGTETPKFCQVYKMDGTNDNLVRQIEYNIVDEDELKNVITGFYIVPIWERWLESYIETILQ